LLKLFRVIVEETWKFGISFEITELWELGLLSPKNMKG